MQLPFLDRGEELMRLRRVVAARRRGFGVLYGRRRCGKSRLLLEALPAGRSVYYVADDREGPLQRAALATELARLLPGFGRVTYPDWDALLVRVWEQAPAGTVLAIDEFPALVTVAPELSSLLQKRLDAPAVPGPHLLLAGSSQRMMQALVPDRAAPLYGRATEILKIEPLPCGWVRKALRTTGDRDAVEAVAVWGGIPRYWELAADYPDREAAIQALVLSPLGVLYDDPPRLFRDDLRDLAQAASFLTLIGQGCQRPSEITSRLGKPATSLSRPLERVLAGGLVRRDQPFGASPRDSKRSRYRIGDPFLRFWFRCVAPNRSRLEARQGPAGGATAVARARRRGVGRSGPGKHSPDRVLHSVLGCGAVLVGPGHGSRAARGGCGGGEYRRGHPLGGGRGVVPECRFPAPPS